MSYCTVITCSVVVAFLSFLSGSTVQLPPEVPAQQEFMTSAANKLLGIAMKATAVQSTDNLIPLLRVPSQHTAEVRPLGLI